MASRTAWKPLLALCVASALLAGPAGAQESGASSLPDAARVTFTALTGTLAKARSTGSVALGYREDAIPFSFLNARKQPVGYSIELCKALVSSIEDAIERTVDIQWVPVTADSRIDAVVTGRVDLECGSTTSNVERQKRVAFSPVIFVAGTKVMVKWGSPISSFRDLAGRTVAVTAGTTNEKALRDLDQKFKLGMRLQVVNTHADGYARVTRGEADAFATDDVLLYGLLAQHGKAGGGAEMVVVGDYLSYDPYAIMFRKDDPQLAQLVKDSFQVLAEDGEIERQYRRWFLRKLPTGASLDLPMSAQLQTLIETMAIKSQ